MRPFSRFAEAASSLGPGGPFPVSVCPDHLFLGGHPSDCIRPIAQPHFNLTIPSSKALSPNAVTFGGTGDKVFGTVPWTARRSN